MGSHLSEIVAVFDSVSKKFTRSVNRPRTFQEIFLHLFRPGQEQRRETFWVFRDITLRLQAGETVGLIGPNGAGKSTLLKLASGIIAPTDGRVSVSGRVGALLELGTGFHPDLSGRENILLDGSLMGLSRAQIRQQLDAIIDFSGLQDFIDAPVKHYSSGMIMRLGFSIMVHVSPDLLLVDEVLAVGDVLFQQKCLKRINEMREQGVAILFVSHNLDSIRSTCQRVIWMEKGQIRADGPPEAVVQQYLWHSYEQSTLSVASDEVRRWGSKKIAIEEVELLDDEGKVRKTYATGEPLVVRIRYHAPRPVHRPVFGLAVYRGDGIHISGPNTRFGQVEIPEANGDGVVEYTVPQLPLLEGTYYISVSSHNWEDSEMYDFHDRLYPFQVVPSPTERYGMITLQGHWTWKP
jgi:lipopolysaccharide transport system ATP-binding protein